MRWKLWLNIITFAALVVLVFFAWPDITAALERSKGLSIWPLLAMIPLQILVFWGIGKFYYYFFDVIGIRAKMGVLFPAMMELNFVNHIFPSGGLSGFSYLTLRLKPLGVSTAKSTLAQLGRFGFGFIVHVLIMFVALFLLAIEGRASSLVVFIVSGFVFTLLFSILVLWFVISSESRSVNFSQLIARLLNKGLRIFMPGKREPIEIARVTKTFTELHVDYKLIQSNLRRTDLAIFWLAIANVCEFLLLYAVFVAHGTWINPGAAAVALIIASTAGLIAVLPGGLGVFEPLMSAVLIAMGIPPGLAISATLIYRVISLLLSLLAGGFLYQRVVQKYGTTDIHS